MWPHGCDGRRAGLAEAVTTVARNIDAAPAMGARARAACETPVALGTVKRIEAAREELTGNAQTMGRIQRALEAAGIVFIEQDGRSGPGVQLREPIRL